MNNDKENLMHRDELHRNLWKAANDHRGQLTGIELMPYILGFMFYRYISENLTNYINKDEHDIGDIDFNYENLTDEQAKEIKEEIVKDKGFFILPSELFANVVKRATNNPDLNIELGDIFKNISKSASSNEKASSNFNGLFNNIDLNDVKLGQTVEHRNQSIVKFLNNIKNIKFGDYNDISIDVFGDAYEYLIGMFAANSGKKSGEFYTPQEVSELLTKLSSVGKTEIKNIYDPACGSGSLLLQAIKILGNNNIQGFYGQELNYTTYNLCRMNMFLHNVGYDKFHIALGDTLINPQYFANDNGNQILFDVIVSNPPYSVNWDGDKNPLLINDERFSPAGVLAPRSKGDFAFIMHSLAYLDVTGVASIVCFPGIMYRGGAEQKIRQYLIDNNYIDTLIQLPSNLFFGTSIATTIMVIKKSKADNNILFIDASNEFVKVTNSNKLTPENIQNILNAFVKREDIDYFAKVVSNTEIKENNYNLSVSSYVQKEDTREKIDIKTLNMQIDQTVKKANDLRIAIDQIIKDLESLKTS